MFKEIVFPQEHLAAVVIKYADAQSYLLTVLFIALNLTTSWIFHQFHMAGPTFLPMHVFVLLGGLLFGWRAGLVIGLFTPISSYGISGMPPLPILPQVVIELAAYGLAAGILHEKYHFHPVWALLAAMLTGRLALLLAVSMISLFGTIASPLGPETSPLAVVWSAAKQGWPGIVIQLAAIPLITGLSLRLKDRI